MSMNRRKFIRRIIGALIAPTVVPISTLIPITKPTLIKSVYLTDPDAWFLLARGKSSILVTGQMRDGERGIETVRRL